jgi:hypothetical protein
MEARVVFDLEYMRNWSPFLDLQILVATVFACASHGSGVLMAGLQEGVSSGDIARNHFVLPARNRSAALGSHDRDGPLRQEPGHLPARGFLGLRMVVGRTSLVAAGGLQSAWMVLIAYAIFTWLIAGLVINYQGYDLIASGIRLKRGLIDPSSSSWCSCSACARPRTA